LLLSSPSFGVIPSNNPLDGHAVKDVYVQTDGRRVREALAEELAE
jgi:hypothetical protein